MFHGMGIFTYISPCSYGHFSTYTWSIWVWTGIIYLHEWLIDDLDGPLVGKYTIPKQILAMEVGSTNGCRKVVYFCFSMNESVKEKTHCDLASWMNKKTFPGNHFPMTDLFGTCIFTYYLIIEITQSCGFSCIVRPKQIRHGTWKKIPFGGGCEFPPNNGVWNMTRWEPSPIIRWSYMGPLQ